MFYSRKHFVQLINDLRTIQLTMSVHLYVRIVMTMHSKGTRALNLWVIVYENAIHFVVLDEQTNVVEYTFLARIIRFKRTSNKWDIPWFRTLLNIYLSKSKSHVYRQHRKYSVEYAHLTSESWYKYTVPWNTFSLNILYNFEWQYIQIIVSISLGVLPQNYTQFEKKISIYRTVQHMEFWEKKRWKCKLNIPSIH